MLWRLSDGNIRTSKERVLPPTTDATRHPLDAGALGGLGGSEGRDDGVLSHHWRVPLGTKSALARWRNLFPVEQLRPVEHLGPAKAAHRREEPYEK